MSRNKGVPMALLAAISISVVVFAIKRKEKAERDAASAARFAAEAMERERKLFVLCMDALLSALEFDPALNEYLESYTAPFIKAHIELLKSIIDADDNVLREFVKIGGDDYNSLRVLTKVS